MGGGGGGGGGTLLLQAHHLAQDCMNYNSEYEHHEDVVINTTPTLPMMGH